MTYTQILYDKDTGTGAAVITLNKPEVLNAYGLQMREELLAALDEASADPEVRGVILTGAGRAFSSGLFQGTGDKTGHDSDRVEEKRALLGLTSGTPRLVERMHYFDKPIIAAVNGIVAGGAINIMSACDIRIASEQARFTVLFPRSGTPPWSGCSYWLTKLIGVSHTLELAYTNDFIDAREMLRIGMVNRVVPHEELIPYSQAMIERMKQIAPSVLFATKRAIRACGEVTPKDLEQGYIYEEWANSLVLEEERTEAGKSLREKRQPVYKGRGIKINIRW
ncbi:MAG: enoyl-CoA hydratase/isomerase family protein [Dehalococcoidales bacterium]|nr:enoyl-CoA hydratase/isomerase family protein [Dehalococcoidales bacterium]